MTAAAGEARRTPLAPDLPMMPAAPAYLAPTFRYAGDDWSGANALTYVVYQTPPVLNSDGSVATAGVPQPLTGYTVAGSLYYQPRCAGASMPGSPNLPALTGAIVGDPANGIISLSLPAAQTIFPRQSLALWANPGTALLIVQPRIVDTANEAVTVGLQQLFVF